MQFIVSGIERIGIAKLDSLNAITEYDDAGDCVFLEGTGDFITLSAGYFAVFHPSDAHMPCVSLDTSVEVRKVVVKINVGME